MRFVASAMVGALAFVQSSFLPLPPNYKTTLDNADVLVMKVHYGAHEFVPLHDHSAYPTLYLYLNDSGEVELRHEGENGFVAKRPPTHTAAWRISPGMAERHSVQSLSDTPSDFLRIELKEIPKDDLKKVFRGEAPAPPVPGTKNEFKDAALEVDRTICAVAAGCTIAPSQTRAVLAAIVPMRATVAGKGQVMQPGDVLWLPAGTGEVKLSMGAQCLRVGLLYPAGGR